MELPKISIVTPSFNQGKFLEETMLSVLNQNYPNLEYIVIDGASADDSVEIIKRHADRLAYWVSEPDRGQTSAINKGLKRATGEVVSYINSDDLYLPGCLHTVGHYFAAHPECRWLCGTVLTFGLQTEVPDVLTVPPTDNITPRLLIDTFLPTPAMFWRRDAFEEFGLFDEEMHYSFDLEHWMRMLVGGVKYARLERPLTAFRLHPTSKTVSSRQAFVNEEKRVREKFLPLMTPRERDWLLTKERQRDAVERLMDADSRWRSGDKAGGVVTGLEAFRRSPARVTFYCAKRVQRLITGDRVAS
jgi:glycosyltransferase involved in cell wall biosynthesis